MKRSPKRAVRWIFFALLSAVCFLNYWEYSREFHKDPSGYLDLIEGRASAPVQYRVLIVRAAWFIQKHSPLAMRHAFALFDFAAGAITGVLLLKLLERSAAFRRGGTTEKWLAYAAFLFLFAYYLIWLQWFQRPETLPTTCFVVLMLSLISWRTYRAAGLAAVAAGTLALSLLQALTRADVACCFYAGVLLYGLFAKQRPLPAPRSFIVSLSSAAIALAAGVQWYIMHRIYPGSTYGDTDPFQLPMNLTQILRIGPFLFFLLPVLWTAWIIVRRRNGAEPAMLALLLGSLLFLPLWLVLGKIDEVRIYIPFAVALIPLTVSTLLTEVTDEPAGRPADL